MSLKGLSSFPMYPGQGNHTSHSVKTQNKTQHTLNITTLAY